MMRILLDTNVVLDVLLNREPWVAEAGAIWQANDDGRLDGFLMASALTDMLLRRRAGSLAEKLPVPRSKPASKPFEFCPVDRHTLERAHVLSGTDFEDNLQMVCAEIAQLDAIVTHDPDDFKTSTVPALTPTQILAQLG